MTTVLNYNALAADAAIWFANAAAWNTYLSSITVTIANATTGSEGVVRQSAALTSAISNTFPADYYVTINYVDPILGTTTVYNLANKDAVDQLQAEVLQLQAAISELRTKFVTAGLVAP